MDLSREIKEEVLRQLYEYEFYERGERNLYNLSERRNWDERIFERTIDRMAYDNLIKPHAMGGVYRILALGVLRAEDWELVSEDLIEENLAIRRAALERLAEEYQVKGRSLGLHYSQILPDSDYEGLHIVRNLQVLADLYHVEPRGSGSFEITFSGIDLVKEWQGQEELSNVFKSLREMKPHPRGRKFQEALSQLIAHHGWRAEESVRTSNEEMDVIFSKRREYFLVECKWEKDAIETGIIRDLYGKISNRAWINGILASMSGFSGGAVDQARDYSSERIILFFGPRDIEKLFVDGASFDEMLDSKYEALVAKRDIVFE